MAHMKACAGRNSMMTEVEPSGQSKTGEYPSLVPDPAFQHRSNSIRMQLVHCACTDCHA